MTRRVWEEVGADPTRAGAAALVRARDSGLLAVVDEGDEHAFGELDAGEATVLSAAAAVGGAVLIDELKARQLAARDARLVNKLAAISGILGLLLVAKRRGRIVAVRPFLDALEEQSFRIAPSLRRQVLEAADE